MCQWNTDRVVDARGAVEGRVEILTVELPNDLEADFARDVPVKFASGEFAAGFAADVDGEGGGGVMKELFCVIVGKNDPEVGLERLKLFADIRCDRAHLLDELLVLGVGHREELRGMRKHRAADYR